MCMQYMDLIMGYEIQSAETYLCNRTLNGNITISPVGWTISMHTSLSVIPIFLMAITILGFFALAHLFGAPKKVPCFMPTSHISLVVATANGQVTFPSAVSAQPQDEFTWSLEIKFSWRSQGWVYHLRNNKKHDAINSNEEDNIDEPKMPGN